MKISVLTPCLNASRTIGYTLESFLAQTHTDKELLVLDGGSTDETMDIVRSYPGDVVSVISEPDQGMYDALNRGLRLYCGDALGCLNADDRYCDSSVLADIADALTHADVVSGNLDFVRDHESSEIVRRWRGTDRPDGGFRTGWMPAHPTFYVRRKVAEMIGEFELQYSIAADYDWMLRAYEIHRFRSRHLDRTIVKMHLGGRSNSGIGSRIKHNLQALRSRRQWLKAGFVDYAFAAKPFRKTSQFFRGDT